MAVINDVEKKNRPDYREPVIIHAPTETLTCSRCGKSYFSRGKHDSGICRECEKKEKAHLVGGPLDGEKAYD